MLFYSHLRPQNVELGTYTYELIGWRIAYFLPLDPRLARCLRVHSGQNWNQSRFPGSIWAEKTENLTFDKFHGERFEGDFVFFSVVDCIFFTDFSYDKGLIDGTLVYNFSMLEDWTIDKFFFLSN